MEPSGRNRWQSVANGSAPETAQTTRSAPVATHGNDSGMGPRERAACRRLAMHDPSDKAHRLHRVRRQDRCALEIANLEDFAALHPFFHIIQEASLGTSRSITSSNGVVAARVQGPRATR